MRYLKTYNKLFESVGNDLSDIFLEVNDETYWSVNCWDDSATPFPGSQDERWVVVIKTVDECKFDLNPPPIVTESIERAIDFMSDEGFTNYQITFENDGDIHIGGSAEFEEINLEDVSGLDVWSNEFIRIEFWK